MEKDNERDVFTEERELLHKQLELLAEKSKECSAEELPARSEQMVAIYLVLSSSW